jgi:hypothetical protein
MRRSRRTAAVAVLLLALASCGLDEGEQAAADSLAGALGGGRVPESTQDSAACVAKAWVGEVGTKRLTEDGLLTEDGEARRRALAQVLAGTRTTSRHVAEGYAAAWVSCADYDVISLDKKKDGGPSAEQLDEYADCLKEIDDDLWRRAIADRWTGSPGSRDETALQHDLAGCEGELHR